jgi:hypothetical protein
VNVQEERFGGVPIARSSVGARTMLLRKKTGHREFHVGPPQKNQRAGQFVSHL